MIFVSARDNLIVRNSSKEIFEVHCSYCKTPLAMFLVAYVLLWGCQVSRRSILNDYGILTPTKVFLQVLSLRIDIKTMTVTGS